MIFLFDILFSSYLFNFPIVDTDGVAFTVCVGTEDLTNLGQFQTIIFEQEVTNIGGYYHTTTGVFTAPEAGVYVFHLSAMTRAGKYMYLAIVRDGVRIGAMLVDGRGDSSWETTTDMWVLSLERGSEVWIQTVEDEGEIHGACHTMFSGFLLYFIDT